jgi:signal transduction histidine kinase
VAAGAKRYTNVKDAVAKEHGHTMSIAAMDPITGRSFPELAAAVKAVAADTAIEWDLVVRATLSAADRLTMDALRDDLPEMLQQIAGALESDHRNAAGDLSPVLPERGGAGYPQGFKLDELLVGFSILRSTLVQQAAGYLGRNLETAEVMALGAALDACFGRSATRLVDHLTRQLQAATEAQSKYLAFLSHDLRGGLNGVFLMIEVLKRELAGEKRLASTIDDLDVMRRSLMETVATMDRFLHAERFRKGKVQVRPSTLSLRNVLQETATHFTYQARDKDIELRVEMEPDCTIISDKDLISLILQNLIANALKYTQSGTAVTLAFRQRDEACTISVNDQGPGISPEKMSELFDPFSRGETYGQPGVGLGLSIAHQAAEYLHARLWAESELGKGATFFVELPKEFNPTGTRP